MVKQLCIAGMVAFAAVAVADEKQVETVVLEKDGIKLTVGGEDGYTITVDGVPFSAVSKLFIVDPGWSSRFYGYNDDKQRVVDAQTTDVTPGAAGMTYNLMSGRSETIEGTQTLEILPNYRLRVATDLRMTSNTTGIVENRIASISEGWLTNAGWSAVLNDGSTTGGITPRWAPGTQPSESTLLKNFKAATFETPRGPLTIETSGSASIALVDYRRNQWSEGKRYYWFGVLGSELPGMDVLSYEVVFTFPAAGKAAPSGGEMIRSPLISTSHTVLRTPPPTDRIIPTPKQVTWGEGVLREHFDLSVMLAQGGPSYEEAINVVSEFQQRFQQLYGISLTAGKNRQALIYMSSGIKGITPVWPDAEPEGYSLTVSEKQVQISKIVTVAGLRHAFRTLEQLVRTDDNMTFGLRRAEINDWPSMPFRGIHFFTGKDSRDLQLKMVNEILAPLKINNLVYQVDYVKWDSQPQIHSEILSMDKADAIAVGDAAKKQGIDVIPLVNTFGHSEWLLQRPGMRHLADDPEDPYAYDPSNPKVYEICEEIYREAIAMFSPKTMHIGHDEVHLDGFPKKPENQAVGATQLFINDTVHYYEFLKKLGIRTMMWGDMLLGPGEAPDAALAPTVEEAKRRRSLLPKDIIIADWHYKSAPVEAYNSPKTFNEDGFEAIGCTWSSADNIVRFAKAITDQRNTTTKSLGLMQTTWAGYSFDEKSLVENLDQYAAYVLAAEAAWTGGYADSKDVPFDYHEEFLRRWNGETVSGGENSGWVGLLDIVANRKLSASEVNLADDAFTGLKSGINRLGKYTFDIPEIDGMPGSLYLSGAWSTAQTTVTQVWFLADAPLQTKELYMAMATPFWVPDGTPVGRLVVTLDDDSTHTVPLIYGKNAMSISDGRQTLVSPVVWKSEEAEVGQGGAAIHVLRWESPQPDKKIKSLQLTTDRSGPGLLVFGMSGV